MRRIAKSILYNGDRILSQKRDSDLEKYPGVWTLFGGNIKEGENPEEALRRELLEELDYELGEVRFLFTLVRKQDKEEVEDNIFACEVGRDILECELKEGEDMRFFGVGDLDKLNLFPNFKKYILEYFS